MRILIETIPHDKQRYETTGDWYMDEQGLHITISKLPNWKSEILVAIHELIEATLCESNGISEKSVTVFDTHHPELEDPGLDSRAPYHKEHMVATAVEMLLCQALQLDWNKHNEILESLYTEPVTKHHD